MNPLQRLRQGTVHGLAASRQLIKAHYGWSLAILGVVLTAIALYVELHPNQALTREEQRLVDVVPPKVGWHCRPYPGTFRTSLAPLISAAVECDPTDPGPEFLSFRLYTSSGDMDLYMHKLYEISRREGATCDEDYPTFSRWVDANGEIRGQFVCQDYRDSANVYWSDEDSLIVGRASVSVAKEHTLHIWWQRAAKGEGVSSSSLRARRHLISLLPPEFGKCESLPVIQSPMALASVGCSPRGGITFAGGSLFPTQRLLDNYIREHAAGYPGVSAKGCNESTFSFTTYGPGSDGRPTQGRLLCYVHEGAQWFEWTVNRFRLFAYAARADEAWSRLYQAWSQSLSSSRRDG